MSMTSYGDLAHTMLLQTRARGLRQRMETLTGELSTGRVADVTSRVGGDFSYLADIERKLGQLDTFGIAAREAGLFTENAQLFLGRLQDGATSLATDLLSTTPSHVETIRVHNSERARQELHSAISALNGESAGQAVFGGIETGHAPLASADTLLTALSAEIAGLTTEPAIRAAVDAWFASPAGFETVMYSGSTTSLAPLRVGPGQEVSMSLRADNEVFRQMLGDMALAALAADPGLGLDYEVQNDIFRTSSEGLMSTQETLSGVRADLGFAQSRIEETVARNSAAETALNTARTTLLSADPFETAVTLEDVQSKLENLLVVTARSSQLSLVNFLR